MMIKIILILLLLLLAVLFSWKRAAPEERRKSRNVTSMFSLVISLHAAAGPQKSWCSREGLGGGGAGITIWDIQVNKKPMGRMLFSRWHFRFVFWLKNTWLSGNAAYWAPDTWALPPVQVLSNCVSPAKSLFSFCAPHFFICESRQLWYNKQLHPRMASARCFEEVSSFDPTPFHPPPTISAAQRTGLKLWVAKWQACSHRAGQWHAWAESPHSYSISQSKRVSSWKPIERMLGGGRELKFHMIRRYNFENVVYPGWHISL